MICKQIISNPKKHTRWSQPFLCLWWAGAASAATRYPEPAWSRCRSEWTAASEYAQTSSDLVPILVWPSEGSRSGTRHLGDPEIFFWEKTNISVNALQLIIWCDSFQTRVGDKEPD